MASVEVSIVIVNYNVKELLLTCLRSLYHFNQSVSLEVIVIDNQSKDGSCEAIKAEFPQVVLIENKDNAGFPKANNQGFRVANGEFIFMLNPDTEFLENSIEKLLSYLKENKDVEFVGPKLLNTDRTLQKSAWRFPSIKSVFCESFYLTRFLKKKNYLEQDWNKDFQAESFSGAAIFFRKSLLGKIGELDESMFWIEDVEFCYRAAKQNLVGIFFSNTAIVHHIGQSAKKNYNISLSNQVFNKIKFFQRHHGSLQTVVIKIISLVHVLYKLVLFGVLSPLKPIYYRKWKAYVYTFPKIFNPPKGIA